MSSRMNLKDFQQELARRLENADTEEKEQAALLAVSAGSENWLVTLPDAGEIVPVNNLASVPLTLGWFRGLANVRGNLFSVVDLAAFGGEPPEPLTSDARIMLVGVKHGLNTAVLVSKAFGLRNPDDFEVDNDFEDQRSWVGGGMRDSQGKLWKLLVVRSLMTDPRFLDAREDRYKRGSKI